MFAGEALDARGSIYDIADDGVFEILARADHARDHISAVNSDSHIQRRKALVSQILIVSANAIAQGDRGDDGIHRVPGIAFWRAEDSHYPVANELGHVTAMMRNGRAGSFEVAIKNAHEGFRAQTFAQGGKLDDIRKKDRYLPRLTRGGDTALDHLLDDALRRELMKGLLQILKIDGRLFTRCPKEIRSPFHTKKRDGDGGVEEDRSGGDTDQGSWTISTSVEQDTHARKAIGVAY